jgi:hypothetical protein
LSVVPALIAQSQGGSAPSDVRLAQGFDLDLRLASVLWNGAGASGPFLACLSVYAQSGELMGRFFPDQILAIGDTAEVTYLPFSRKKTAPDLNTQAGFFAYVQTLGPWAFYPMQEAAGDPQDFSGHGFHTTTLTSGPVTYQVPGPYADGVAIRFPAGAYFAGVDAGGYPVTDGITWVCWVRLAGLPIGGTGYGRIWRANIATDTHDPNKWSAERVGVAYLGDSVATVPPSTWTYLALVHRNSDDHYLLYVNGVYDSDLGSGGIPGGGTLPIEIGPKGTGYTLLDLCNCVVWARILSPAEIASLLVA